MRRTAVVAGLVVAASTAVAQAPKATGPDSLPRELVEALLHASVSTYPGDGSAFVVGRIPPSLAPFLFVPKDARVLGGMSNSNNTVAVFTIGMSRDELRNAYSRELPRLGWTPSNGRPGFSGWGFMPAPGSGPMGGGLEYCHIGQSLQINPTETPSGLSVTAVVRNYGGTCGGRTPAFVGSQPAVDLPILTNPADAGMNTPGCFQPTIVAFGTRATSERLESSMPADKLLDHFARQLSDSGWTATRAQGVSARRTWTRPDTGSTMRELTLTIAPSASPACQEITMQVRQVRKP